MVTACTIIARNYLAQARVLADSFFAHHPGGSFTLLLIDDERRELDDSRESFRCWRLSDIGLAPAEIGRLAAIYDVTELATAVKPQLLRRLLSSESAEVIYLDPDIKLYRSLEEVAALARKHAIVLTPHMTASMPRDGRRVDEFHILAAGVYNLGFIAVGPRSEAFIDWWWQKTRREARVDPTRMMFTDQRWVDFVPSFFDHFILKDPTYNVAYWNLHERDLIWTDTGYLVDEQPLTFFHFSGFDSAKPYLLSKHQGERPRILLSERPAVAKICSEYRTSVEAFAASPATTGGYGWNRLPSGLSYDRRMRRLYREALSAYEAPEADRSLEPPNPFTADDAQFIEWLNQPVVPMLRPTVSRYLYSIYEERIDLQTAFPDLAGADGDRFMDWIHRHGVADERVQQELLPKGQYASSGFEVSDASSLTSGVNLAGYFRAELGVGEAARLLTSAIAAAAIPYSTLTYDVTPSRKEHPFLDRGDPGAPHDVNILCVNADQTPRFAKEVGPAFFAGRHTVGYWFWEIEVFPKTMHHAFDYVDEVWTATRFVAGGIREIGRKAVYTIPLPVPVPQTSRDVTRNSLGLPNGFMFLFVFDFFSVLERKNPTGLIEAFTRAFRPGEGPILVIKTINGERRLNDLEKVRRAAASRPDILLIDEYYTFEQKNSLLGLCDCYVSLHRSEGFGLTLAEAMALEKPVIATAYSGNMDFMTPLNSYLVDYTLVAVPEGTDPYPPGSPWAEPNLDQAAELLQVVYQGRPEVSRKARQARQDILTEHSVDAAATVVSQRLDEIRHSRSRVKPEADSARRRAGFVDPEPTLDYVHPGLSESLARATDLLTPTASVAPGRGFRAPLVFLQDLLFRVLRPYWWQQRQIQTTLISGLRDVAQLAARAARMEPRHREALEAMRADLRSMEAEVNQQQARGWATSRQMEAVAVFQDNAAAHLKALTDQLALTSAEVRELSNRLYAVPYMRDENWFRYTAESGKPVLGFRSGRQGDRERYLGFEDIFRGSEALIAERLSVYIPLLTCHARVIDIGCGRGEMLDLLSRAGVRAVGVDSDPAMIQCCRAKGHHVEQADALDYLRGLDDGSVPAIFAAQVVEHLPYADLIAFLQLSHAKLKPHGQLIFETVNPHALEAFKTFWTDLTHQRPIFPEVALAWCSLLGFDCAYVLFPNGVGDLERDRRTQGEYGIVATKSV